MEKIFLLGLVLSVFILPNQASAVIQSLDGLTGQNQTFTDDTNVTITPSGTTHILGWSGLLPLSRGGTGASSLANLITLGTHTIGNFIATMSGSSQISVSGSGSESAVVTLGINPDSIGASELNIIDGDSPSDEDCLTRESGGSNGSLEWQPCGSDEVYGASWDGSTEAPTKNSLWDKIETMAGLIWGTSISGTTADGLTLNLSNSSDDAAGALKIIAGNTQTNQPVLANLQMGSSENVMGLLIKGIGSDIGGDPGIGKNHLTLWSNADSSNKKLISAGNGCCDFSETFSLDAEGHMKITPGGTTNYVFEISPNSQTRGILNFSGSGTSGAITRSKLNINTSFTGAMAAVTLDGKGMFEFTTKRNENTANTRTNDFDHFYLERNIATSNAGANYTEQGSVANFVNLSTQTSGTLANSVDVLKLSQSASSTGLLINAQQADTSVFTVSKVGTLHIGTSAIPGCIAMSDSNGSGIIYYVTITNGALAASSTQPSNCH